MRDRLNQRTSGRWDAICLAAIATVVLVMGCKSLDPTSFELADAAVAAAKNDQRVAQHDSLHMEDAERHLALAEKELDDNGEQQILDHEAYMAATHAEVARVLGEASEDEAVASAYLRKARRDTAGTERVIESAVLRARALDAEQTERGLELTLGGVLFEFDSAELKPEANLAMAKVAGFLIALEDRVVLVEGYTDSMGAEDYNIDLSKRRAETVRALLIENQVGENRIIADGFGPAYPVASNDTAVGREKNRRVQIVILEPGLPAVGARR